MVLFAFFTMHKTQLISLQSKSELAHVGLERLINGLKTEHFVCVSISSYPFYGCNRAKWNFFQKKDVPFPKIFFIRRQKDKNL